MADNTTLNAGSGGDTFRTEDRGSFKVPVSLIDVGGTAGPEAIIGDSGVTMPVSLTSVPSHAVTNAGTFAVQVDGAALTSLQLIDDVVLAEDAAHSTGDKGVMGLSVRRDTAAATSGTDGDYQPLITDSTGRLWCNVSNTVTVTGTGGTFPITDSGGSITVDNGGTFAVQAAQSGTWTVQPGNTANTTAWLVTGTGGTFPATQSGTWNIATVTTVTTCSVVSSLTGSGTAHDAVDSGNPHKLGAKATTSLSGLTLVASADRTDLFAGVDGVLITRPHSNLEDLLDGTADITDGSSTSVIAAQGAGVRVYITDVVIANSSASAVTVTLRDGAAGTVKATFMVPAGCPNHKTFQSPIRFSANTAVCADPSAAASTVSVSLSGFKSKV